MNPIERYGAWWPADYCELAIEFGAIRLGGKWKDQWVGKECGLGLFYHYKRAQQLLWPTEDHHRWSDLILENILANNITVLSGPKDSNKTHSMAKYALVDYWCFPEETLIIVSSTTLPALEGRVWGDIKHLFREGKDRFDWLAGVVVDSKHAICTDDLTDESVTVRDMRRGLLCIPCKEKSGGDIEIAPYVGMKQKRRRWIGDEFSFMSRSMYDSLANGMSGNFKLIAAGNPLGQGDPLDLLSEPKGGWGTEPQELKTAVWENRRFLNSKTVSLIGTDSPNFDFPQDQAPRYWYMINKDSIANTVAGYGKESSQYWQQCVGKRMPGMLSRRVLTLSLCEQNHAFEEVIWDGQPTTKIGGLDAAYGGSGGDRCVGGWIEFGKAVGGKIILMVHPPILVPVMASVRSIESHEAEDQIAYWCLRFFPGVGVPPENFFYDSTGRGSLGIPLARIWSGAVNPVEFGGSPSERPVSLDHYLLDMKTSEKKLKTCREEYSKRVTELWWNVRFAIEAGQVRGLPRNVADEGCMREWKTTKGGKTEIETKVEMKDRVGHSPDLFDWLAVCVEGAIQRGFRISKMANPDSSEQDLKWFWKLGEGARRARERVRLNYAA